LNKIKVFNVDGSELGDTTPARCRRWIKSGRAVETKDNLGRFAVMVTDYQIKTRDELDVNNIDLKEAFGINQLDNPIVEYATTKIKQGIDESPVASILKRVYDPVTDMFLTHIDKNGNINHIPMKQDYIKQWDWSNTYFKEDKKYEFQAHVVPRRGATPEERVEVRCDFNEKLILKDSDVDAMKDFIMVPTFEIACHPILKIGGILNGHINNRFFDEYVDGALRALKRERDNNIISALGAASESKNKFIETEHVSLADIRDGYTCIDKTHNVIITEEVYRTEFNNRKITEKDIVLIDVSNAFDEEYLLKYPVCAGSFYDANLIVIPYGKEKKVFFTGSPEKVGLYGVKQKPMCFVKNEYERMNVGLVCIFQIGLMLSGNDIFAVMQK